MRTPPRTNETQIQEASRIIIFRFWDENLDRLLIKKQEPRYSEDATTNYGLLVDKSG